MNNLPKLKKRFLEAVSPGDVLGLSPKVCSLLCADWPITLASDLAET